MKRKPSRLIRAVRATIENLESRLLLSGTPHTSDGSPWLIAANGVSWVEAEDFDNGGEGVGYHDSSTANQGGKYRLSEGVDIEGPAANTGNTYNIGYVTAGEWLNYTINVAQAGTYQLTVRASNANTATASAHVTFGGGVNSGAISIPNTGGWGNYQSYTATVTLNAGTQVMQITDDSGAYNLEYLSLQQTSQLGGEQAYGSRGLPPLVPAGGQATIEAENYDTGGQNVGYFRTSTTKSSTATLNGQPFRAADLVSTSNGGTGIYTSYWKPTDWTQYIVNTAVAGKYEVLINYARGDNNNSNFSIAANGSTQVVGLALPSTASWTTYKTVGAVLDLAAGPNVIRFTTGVGQINFDYFTLIQSNTFGNGGASWYLPASGSTRIEAENFNNGAAGYSDTTPGNSASSAYRPGTDVDLENSADTGGGANITSFDAGEYVNYSVRPELTGNYDLRLRVKSTAGGQLKVQFDDNAGFDASTNPELLTFTPNVSAGAGWQTITLPVRFMSGLQTMRITAVTGGVDLNWFELQKNTSVATKSPGGTGTYAAEPPDAALNSNAGLFDRVYVKQYDWINRPAGAAIPTNDWWTQILESPFAGSLWAYPQSLNDSASGVNVNSYNALNITAGNVGIGGKQTITVGGTNDTFTRDALLDYGDWTIHYRMQEAGANSIDVTTGRGLPYTWFEFNGVTPRLTVGGTFTAYDANNTALGSTFTTDHFRIDNGGKQFGLFAPAGTTFTLASGKYTVTFSGPDKYLVVAVLPDPGALDLFYQHAYAIPRQGADGTPSSKFDFNYDAAAGSVNTTWSLNTQLLRAGFSSDTIQGWLPQDYETMTNGPTLVPGYTYPTIQGAVKIAVGHSFTFGTPTTGVNYLLAAPQSIGGVSDYVAGQMTTYIQKFITQHKNTAASNAAGTTILNYGDDTYWGGKSVQEVAEFTLMAKQIGDTADYTILLNNLRSMMTDWLTYTPGEAAHYFAYYPDAKALIGFNGSYGSENFTDGMFHYGYFTASAGVLATLDPTWAAQYGQMAKMIAMEYANWNRADNSTDAGSLPYLRTFEPWIGHSYAGGTGDARGNNEESSSESIQSWLGLVLLGQALGDSNMTAAGMMGYTRQSKAVQYQWFDVKQEMFQSTTTTTAYARSNVAINYDDSKGYGTFFGANPEYILGIESLPLWPSLDFLGQYADVAAKATQQMLAQRAVYYNDATKNTFASFESGGVNDWLNITLGFQSMYDPQATANELARMISQNTATGQEGTTGIYYYQDQSYRTYGLRDWNYHLSLPLGGVYSHGNDGTTMANTRTYMVYNGSATAQTVNVYDATGNVVDSFVAAARDYTVVTRQPNTPPTITTAAAASPSPVVGKTTTLTVGATDDAGEPNLLYTWTLVGNPPAAVTFSSNGTNASKSTVATFAAAGAYNFLVTVTDGGGKSTTSGVSITVNQTLTALSVTGPSSVSSHGAAAFTATALDQFNNALATQPSVAWSVFSGSGAIDSITGQYTAGYASGSAIVQATTGGVTGSASISTVNAAPTVSNAANASANPVTATFVTLHALGADSDGGGEANLTYTWSATGPAAVTFGTNGSNASKNILATFTKAGSYSFLVTIGDAGGLSTTSSVNVTVSQTLAALSITPTTNPTVQAGSTQQFTASATDQFGQTMTAPTAWSVTGAANTIDTTGKFTAGNSSGSFTVTASSGALSSTASVTVNASLFAGESDIGATGVAGSSSLSGGVYTIKGSGADIWGSADAFHFVYVPISGDQQIIARVTGIVNTNATAKAGVMFRESLAAGSAEASVLLTPTNGVRFQRRTTTSATTAGTTVSGIAPPYWVKLVRTGNSFMAFRSSDGVTWTKIGSTATITMAGTIYAGLAVSSHKAGTLTTATIDSVSITPVASLSAGRPVTASSTAAGSSPASAVDGSRSTQWTSASARTQWLTVDFGSAKSISRILLNWGSTYAKSFKIQTSTNGTAWTSLLSTTTGTGLAIDLQGINVSARFVRIYMTESPTLYYTISELDVFGI